MKNIKKLLVMLLSVVMLLSLCACGGNTDQGTDPADDEETLDTTAAGTLLLTAEAQLKISYDVDGIVLAVEGMNDSGVELAKQYTEASGKSCTAAVQDLLKMILKSDEFTLQYVFINQPMGSVTPNETFAQTILTDAKIVADGYPVVMATAKDMDSDGYFSADVAKAILLAYLGESEDAKLSCTDLPVDGHFNLTYISDDGNVDYIIDANTGKVEETILEGEEESPTVEDENVPSVEAFDPIEEDPASEEEYVFEEE